MARAGLLARVQIARLSTRLGGAPSFFIHVDPSMFHRPWYRDADAIHWPSIHDLRRATPKGYHFTQLHVHQPGFKGMLWARLLLLFARITREEPGVRGAP
jgi:hypothetical protein